MAEIRYEPGVVSTVGVGIKNPSLPRPIEEKIIISTPIISIPPQIRSD